jgi:two-component system chemotaxis response regulator CheB
MMAQVLARESRLPVTTAVDGQEIRPGHIYTAVPDQHLLLRPGRMMLRRGPQENRSRPSIDALFRSAAVAYGPRVIGVVLTGQLDDGTEGLICITAAGGTSVVQSPEDAAWPSMPRNALARDHVSYSVPMAEMAPLLSRLAREPAGLARPLTADMMVENYVAEQDVTASLGTPPPGFASPFTCPDCGGVLNAIGEDGSRFRCQIGHAFTGLGLQAAQGSSIERALAVAMRTHRERLVLFRQMEEAARARNHEFAALRWARAAEESRQLADLLERTIALLHRPAEAAD